MRRPWPDDRPTIIALAGSNGAGKTTFYEAQLAGSGGPFINADLLAKELSLDPYSAADLAKQRHAELVEQNVRFIFETVLSDLVGEKVRFLKDAAKSGFHVILAFVANRELEQSNQRAGRRVSQGEHAVPIEKLRSRHAGTLDNLKLAIRCLPQGRIFDNSDLSKPYEHVDVAPGSIRGRAALNCIIEGFVQALLPFNGAEFMAAFANVRRQNIVDDPQ